MKKISAALWAEYMKIRNSKILWITILLFAIIPFMMGFMIYIVRHPEISDKLGLIAAKASLFAVNDWTGYMQILYQMNAAIGLIGFGFVTAWIFGREYTEHTIKDILPLPVHRKYIVFAKFVAAISWSVILSIVLFCTGILTGKIYALPGWSQIMFFTGLTKFFSITFLTLLLLTPVGFIASYSQGIIAPIGFTIIVLILAQFCALAGLGPFFPWSIPGQLSIPPVPGLDTLYLSSYIILSLTCILGIYATLSRWNHADQH